MIRLPPRSTRTDTLFPYTTLFRSGHHSRQSSGKDLVAPASSGHVLVPLGRNRRETIRTQKCSWHMLKRGIAAIVLLGPVIDDPALPRWRCNPPRSEEHTSELQSLMRISYAVFCLKKKKQIRPELCISH